MAPGQILRQAAAIAGRPALEAKAQSQRKMAPAIGGGHFQLPAAF
jgi:hypothetical protein